MSALDAITILVVAFFGTRLVQAATRASRGDARSRTLAIVRGLRLRHFVPVPAVAAAVITTAIALVQLPVLDFGWWTALGGQGNPVFGTTERTAGTAFEVLVPLVFIALLTPALPLFAEREEVMFRRGAEDWSPLKRVVKGLQFGLIHAVIGIPIGVALALSIGGWWFMAVYLRGYRRGGQQGALLEATRAHLAYNATIVVLVTLALIASAIEMIW